MSSYFFQIIHNYIIEDERLELPKKFVWKYGEELSEDAVIKDPSGKIWHVEMRKTPEGEIFLENGWQGFMDYFSLRSGHFLIFRYDGSSHFHVYICDMSACEIEYPRQSNNARESHYEEVSTEEDDALAEDLDVSSQCQTRGIPVVAKRAELTCGTSSGSHERRSCDKSESPLSSPPSFISSPPAFSSPPGFSCPPGFAEDNRNRNAGDLCKQNEDNQGKPWVFNFRRGAEVISISSDSESNDEHPVSTKRKHASTGQAHLQEASKAGFSARYMPTQREKAVKPIKNVNAINSENPKFTIVMQPSYVDNRNYPLVHVPSKFAKQFLKSGSQTATIRIPDRKVWDVECAVHNSSAKYEATFRKGWKEFKVHNHLKEGDICVFELVDRDNLGMEVTFSRV
ncbi:hypothetical protein MKX01_005996 [Papaver californicum]|nr:hypothetical protein MKX01_005996 [Papaver californicum]